MKINYPSVDAAAKRLRKSADRLLLMRGDGYGGSIKHDIWTVLDELERLQLDLEELPAKVQS